MADYDQVTCRLNSRDLKSEKAEEDKRLIVPLKTVRQDEFICEYETHCFALCMCCDFFACDCRMKCSDGCSCFHDATWSANVIQCGRKAHPVVPEFIPMDATAIYLDGNNLTDLSTETFIGRKHLTSLYLNASRITDLGNKTLSGLSELLVLHLEHNKLEKLDGGEFNDLVSLKELYLDHNVLRSIHAKAFANLVNLETLTLAHNKLTVFPVWNLLDNGALIAVNMAFNPWSCNCAYLHHAQRFIQERREIIVDADNLQCVVEESRAWNAIGNASCTDVMAVSFRSDQDEGDDVYDVNVSKESSSSAGDFFAVNLLPIVAIVSSSFIIVLSVIILAVAFRKPVSLW